MTIIRCARSRWTVREIGDWTRHLCANERTALALARRLLGCRRLQSWPTERGMGYQAWGASEEAPAVEIEYHPAGAERTRGAAVQRIRQPLVERLSPSDAEEKSQ